jgi:hypothetical protein
MAEVGKFIRLWENDGAVYIHPKHVEDLRLAWPDWVEKGNDAALTLTMLYGDTYYTRCSKISSWAISTPEGRKSAIALEKAQREETQDFRTQVGLPWEDD